VFVFPLILSISILPNEAETFWFANKAFIHSRMTIYKTLQQNG
jgi:hypothetical protein